MRKKNNPPQVAPGSKYFTNGKDESIWNSAALQIDKSVADSFCYWFLASVRLRPPFPSGALQWRSSLLTCEFVPKCKCDVSAVAAAGSPVIQLDQHEELIGGWLVQKTHFYNSLVMIGTLIFLMYIFCTIPYSLLFICVDMLLMNQLSFGIWVTGVFVNVVFDFIVLRTVLNLYLSSLLIIDLLSWDWDSLKKHLVI